jgi:hypothetical protein
MDYEKAQLALHSGEVVEAVVTPAEDADGWTILLIGRQGKRILYTGASGTEKTYQTLDRATAVAREIGFETIRVEESF